jgi:hypothetical protein
MTVIETGGTVVFSDSDILPQEYTISPESGWLLNEGAKTCKLTDVEHLTPGTVEVLTIARGKAV